MANVTLNGNPAAVAIIGTEASSFIQGGADATYTMSQVLTYIDNNAQITTGQVTGLGTMATQNANSVAITGGNINGTVIGGSSAAAGTFTSLNASGNINNSVLTASQAVVTDGSKNLASMAYASTAGSPAGGVSNLVARNAGGVSSFSNLTFLEEYRNALGVNVVLSNSSGQIQNFSSGTTNTNLQMPDATTLVPGWPFVVLNNSTAIISIQTHVGGSICSLAAGGFVLIRCNLTSTSGGGWEFNYQMPNNSTSTNQFIVSDVNGAPNWSASTITLGGNFSTSGAHALILTLTGDTNVTLPTSGTLATTSQLPTGAALTKTDDTNVTLTLGGTPATALLQATSLTLGWTGQLGVTRGGTGLSGTTVNQILYSSSNNVIAGLSTANNGVLATSSGGAPSITSALPTAVQLNIVALGSVSQGNIDNVPIGNATPSTGKFTNLTATLNCYANNFVLGVTSAAGAGGTTVLTNTSTSAQILTGFSGQTYQLPDATTLTVGAIYEFNNNTSFSNLVVNDHSGTTLTTLAVGALVRLILLTNVSSAGTWDFHSYIPSSSTWNSSGLNLTGNLNVSSLTASSLVLANSSKTLTSLVLGAGQIPIGTTSSTPSAATLTAGTGISITSASGSITINATGTGSASIVGIQNQSYTYAADTGTANTYVAATSPALASGYNAGMRFPILISNTNTGPSTLNVSTQGAANIVLASGAALTGNELVAGMVADFEYNGTNMQLNNPAILQSYGQNLIIGGDFSVNPFQRGTPFSGITGAYFLYIADRFQAGVTTSTGATFTYSKTTNVPSISVARGFCTFALRAIATAPATSMPAGDFYTFYYPMEGYDVIRIAGGSFTISFCVYATVSGNYSVGIRNGGNDKSYVATYTINASNTWQYVTLTIPAPPVLSGTWNFTNGLGLGIFFVQGCGSTLQTSSTNQWLSGNFISSASQVNGFASTSDIFAIALVKVEPGNVATPWQPITVAQTLQQCQRYFYMTYPQGSAFGASSFNGQQLLTVGSTVTNTSGFMSVSYPTQRAAPTVKMFSPNSGSINKLYNNNTGTDFAVTYANIGDTNANIFNNQGSSITDGSVLTYQLMIDSDF